MHMGPCTITSNFGPTFLGSFWPPFGLITSGSALTQSGPESTISFSLSEGSTSGGLRVSMASGLL